MPTWSVGAKRHPLGARASRPHPYRVAEIVPQTKKISTKGHEGRPRATKRDGFAPRERGRPARILIPFAVAERQHDFAGSHQVGGNRNGQAEEDPRRRSGSIRAAEMAGVVPGIVRAGRPRSRGGIIHTRNREHRLHRAREPGKAPYASLKNHSPLEGKSARPGRSPQSSRRGQTRRSASDDQHCE